MQYSYLTASTNSFLANIIVTYSHFIKVFLKALICRYYWILFKLTANNTSFHGKSIIIIASEQNTFFFKIKFSEYQIKSVLLKS